MGLTTCDFLVNYKDDVAEAYELIKDLEPTTPQEYILKGVVNAALGQEQGSVSIISKYIKFISASIKKKL